MTASDVYPVSEPSHFQNHLIFLDHHEATNTLYLTKGSGLLGFDAVSLGMWCVVRDMWCVMCGVRCVMCDVWCVMCDAWCVMYGALCVMCGV